MIKDQINSIMNLFNWSIIVKTKTMSNIYVKNNKYFKFLFPIYIIPSIYDIIDHC